MDCTGNHWFISLSMIVSFILFHMPPASLHTYKHTYIYTPKHTFFSCHKQTTFHFKNATSLYFRIFIHAIFSAALNYPDEPKLLY